eukprot:6185580-Pleurochrysis_carterae.AAC.5
MGGQSSQKTCETMQQLAVMRLRWKQRTEKVLDAHHEDPEMEKKLQLNSKARLQRSCSPACATE